MTESTLLVHYQCMYLSQINKYSKEIKPYIVLEDFPINITFTTNNIFII